MRLFEATRAPARAETLVQLGLLCTSFQGFLHSDPLGPHLGRHGGRRKEAKSSELRKLQHVLTLQVGKNPFAISSSGPVHAGDYDKVVDLCLKAIPWVWVEIEVRKLRSCRPFWTRRPTVSSTALRGFASLGVT